MLPKNDRIKPMSDVAHMTSLPRSTVELWVRREQQRTGSRMVAYKNIASAVGTSASWVRKFYSGSPEVKEPSWSIGVKIITAYGQTCERLDRLAEAEQAEAQNLKRLIHAATAITMEVVEGSTRTRSASTGTEQD